jgi:hypothetical protein
MNVLTFFLFKFKPNSYTVAYDAIIMLAYAEKTTYVNKLRLCKKLIRQ